MYYHENMKIADNKLLTKREKEIVLLFLKGKTKQEIADALYLSVSTVKTNIENIYHKFNVHNKAELVIYLFKKSFIEFE